MLRLVFKTRMSATLLVKFTIFYVTKKYTKKIQSY